MPNHRRRDPYVDRLSALFAGHPVWQRAAAYVTNGATSTVYVHHLPGRAWHLVRRGGHTELAEGLAADPDFVFRFSAHAIDRLAAVRGDVGDFALELFERIVDSDESRGVGFRIAAPFARLLNRGYVRLLLAAGPRIVTFGATHGVLSLWQLRRLVEQLRAHGPAAWELLADGTST